jgi:hypothetical protein
MLLRGFKVPSALFFLLYLSTAKVCAESDGGKAKAGTSSTALSEDGVLRRAISLYDTGQYEACVDDFQLLLDPEDAGRLRSPTKIETARVYHGACLIGVGRTLEAETIFRKAILENPQMKTPDSLLFPETVVDLFLRVRESMLDEIRKAEQKRLREAEERANREQSLRELQKERVNALLKLAKTESVVEPHERWMAFIPYGVGQFQNHNKGLGWFFLGSEATVTAVFVASLYMTSWYGSKTDDRGITRERVRELSDAQHNAYLVSTISGWGLLGLTVVGIVEANFAYVPELRRERSRELPKTLKELRVPQKNVVPDISVTLAPMSNAGAGAVLFGHF